MPAHLPAKPPTQGPKTFRLLDGTEACVYPARSLPVLDLCRVVEVPHRGLGVILTSDVKRGKILMREKPFATADIALLDDDGRYSADGRSRRLAKLAGDPRFVTFTPRQDARYADGTAWLASVWDSNGIPLGEPGGEGVVRQTGLFEAMSRVNHSCRPNTVWR
jgi:hypothetical protein